METSHVHIEGEGISLEPIQVDLGSSTEAREESRSEASQKNLVILFLIVAKIKPMTWSTSKQGPSTQHQLPQRG